MKCYLLGVREESSVVTRNVCQLTENACLLKSRLFMGAHLGKIPVNL